MPSAIVSPFAPDPFENALLRRHRGLQWSSIAMIAIGLALAGGAFLLNPGLLEATTFDEVERLLGPLLLIVLGGLLLLSGAVLNAVRAVIVRAGLPAQRYRGPAIFVLLLLALILGNVLALGAAADGLALLERRRLTVPGTLLLLTATQAGMLITVGGLVVFPRALEGLRLVPRGNLWRGMLIGLGLAIPAWIAATLISVLISLALEAFGITPDPGPVEQFLDQADPTVLLVALVVVAPIAEELLFRGVIFNAWERERGLRVAVYGSAFLFAAIHGVFLVLPVLVLGIALAHLYRVTRSLPAVMAMHAGFNAISLTLALMARQGIIQLPT